VRWWQERKIAPTVHAAYPLAEFREAMTALRDRSAFGRIVLLPQE
jgi:NADPH:quinone reductase